MAARSSVVEITAAFDFNEAVSLEELMLVQHEGGESGHSITSDMMRMLLLEARCVCVQGRQEKIKESLAFNAFVLHSRNKCSDVFSRVANRRTSCSQINRKRPPAFPSPFQTNLVFLAYRYFIAVCVRLSQ
jgi:hypothetical protein